MRFSPASGGSNSGPRIGKFAEAGAYIATDLGNFYGDQHESMFAKLKEAGIVPRDQKRLD